MGSGQWYVRLALMIRIILGLQPKPLKKRKRKINTTLQSKYSHLKKCVCFGDSRDANWISNLNRGELMRNEFSKNIFALSWHFLRNKHTLKFVKDHGASAPSSASRKRHRLLLQSSGQRDPYWAKVWSSYSPKAILKVKTKATTPHPIQLPMKVAEESPVHSLCSRSIVSVSRVWTLWRRLPLTWTMCKHNIFQ